MRIIANNIIMYLLRESEKNATSVLLQNNLFGRNAKTDKNAVNVRI